MNLKIILYPLFIIPILLSAQEAPDAPDPGGLAADWWKYFSTDDLSPEETSRRVNQYLKSLPDSIAGRDSLSEAFQEFLTNRQVEFSPNLEDSDLEAKDLESALVVFRAIERLTDQVESLKEDQDWQQSLLDEFKRAQLLQRSNYLEMAPAASDRSSEGIRLMTARARLESRILEVEQLRKNLNFLEERRATLQSRLEDFEKSYTPSTEELSQWQTKYVEVRAKVSTDPKPDQLARPKHSTTYFGSRRAILLQDREKLEELSRQTEERLALAGVMMISHLRDEPSVDDKVIYDSRIGTEKVIEEATGIGERVQRINRAVNEAQTDPDRAIQASDEIQAIRVLADEVEESRRRLFIENQSVVYLLNWLDQNRGVSTGGKANQIYRKTKTFTNRVTDNFGDFLRRPLFEINDTPVNSLAIFRLLLILVIAWGLSRFIRHALDRFGEKQKRVSKTSLYSVQRLVHYLLIAMGILIGLSSIGLDLTKFAIFASALGIGLGFGFQTMVSNFVAGLILLFEKSLKVGDFVELESGVNGEVREINMRSTLITTNDNVDIIVPNSEFVSGRVTNWTLREVYRRIRVPFGVAYGSDKELVRRVVLEAAAKVPWTLDNKRRPPQVWLVSFGDSSLDFELVVWLTSEAVKRPQMVQADYLWEIETCLRDHDIEIPFPQRDLHLRSGFGIDTGK